MNSIMRIDARHLQEWISEGKAIALGVEVTHQLVGHLERLPWNPLGTRLDWVVLDGERANLARLEGTDLADWARSTPLGRDDYLIFILGADQPCFACRTELGIVNIDYIFSGAPGVRYLFGAEMHNGALHPVLDHFAEYDGADNLTVAV